MTLIWIGIAVLVAAACSFFLFGRKAQPARTPPAADRTAATPTTARGARPIDAETRHRVEAATLRDASVGAAATSPSREPATAPRREPPTPLRDEPRPIVVAPQPAANSALPAMPAALAGFEPIRAESLPEARRAEIARTFHDIPRPPKLLHHLLSPAFINAANSAQLVDLIAAEPLIAARVLAAINSPTYGLKSPVASIGQAVTYLGLNTVRGLCLQYILIESFKADTPERKRILEAAWAASAYASELVQQLSQRLGFDDRGSLVSAVVLSFIGRLATTATVSRDQLASIVAKGLLERTVSEQKVLGLGASQIGRLLMADWGLPDKVIADAADIDAVLVSPAASFDAERAARLAVGYVSARLGERLAEDSAAHLHGFDPDPATDAEFFHLPGYLALPRLEHLPQLLRSAELGVVVEKMLAARRA